MSDFNQQLKEKIQEVQWEIERFYPKEEGYAKTVLSAMNYSLKAGGKRLRPLLMKESYLLTGGTREEEIYPFMAAMEMIHTYSLVHDDLPAMDNDDLRRGKPTTHKVYGHAMGILAGDALLNYAYETALKGCKDERGIRALAYLADKAGIHGMVGGQVVDVENNGTFPDEDTLLYVYENKTAALLEASLVVGGYLSGATEETLAHLEEIGRKVGLAFQIQDDLLDELGDEEKLGKPIHSDEKNQKATYVAIHGVEASKKKALELTDQALALVRNVGNNGDETFLLDLIQWLDQREY